LENNIEITVLYEISKALSEHLELKRSLYKVLEILSNSTQMVRGTICLRDPVQDEILIEVAHGLSENAMRRGRYKIGEGITGRVIATGEAVTIPKISEEPLFLDRTASRRSGSGQEVSFICVPVKRRNTVIGALSVDRAYDESYSLETGRRLLSIVAVMIAMHVVNLETIRFEGKRLREENQRLQAELENKYHIQNIIGNSNKMREVYQMISQVCQSNTNVLIRGESGTGKELAANSLHYNSHRAHHPFVKVNCAALPSSLIESELFGHEKGAFTGAIARRLGLFELAHKGTLFLDEIGEAAPFFQSKLLRVVESKTFMRVGGAFPIYSDFRLLVATNRKLEEDVASGGFRQDLFYRLNLYTIEIPPLRNRKEDIPLIAEFYLKRFAQAYNRPIAGISTNAMLALREYDWPGNVRELINVIERAVITCPGDLITTKHLPFDTGEDHEISDLNLRDIERFCICVALRRTENNKSKAADLLGISRKTLGEKLKTYDLDDLVEI